ncbi:MAG: hypothetical protein AVDCRST_MAG06-3297 [uncultured Nocardioides sp.]|uniref:Uncharacterized protein n=1 Tax=uncultured Nocardioides sp. TaxID=198441 RepID=A0A6J4PJB2_9ACTN|nr:MAG: hypothetical protein AVDCRST_MAG06-3297 [uncultured Nocardioides sp.]
MTAEDEQRFQRLYGRREPLGAARPLLSPAQRALRARRRPPRGPRPPVAGAGLTRATP